MWEDEQWQEVVPFYEIDIQERRQLRIRAIKTLLLFLVKTVETVACVEDVADIVRGHELDTNIDDIVKNVLANRTGIKNKIVLDAMAFSALRSAHVDCRLLLIVSPAETIESFLEKRTRCGIKRYSGTTDAVVVGIDSRGCIKNMSILYTRSPKYHAALCTAFKVVSKSDVGVFDAEDSAEYRKIPKTKQGFRNHPYYCLESLLRHDEILHPHWPIVGRHRNENIYLREKVKKIYTRRNWESLGFRVDGAPYAEKKQGKAVVEYFAPWQAKKPENIFFSDLPDVSEMPHRNFIPEDAFLLTHALAEHVCRQLSIACKIAYNFPGAKKTVVVRETDRELACTGLYNALYLRAIETTAEKYHETMMLWNSAIATALRYLYIKKNISSRDADTAHKYSEN